MSDRNIIVGTILLILIGLGVGIGWVLWPEKAAHPDSPVVSQAEKNPSELSLAAENEKLRKALADAQKRQPMTPPTQPATPTSVPVAKEKTVGNEPTISSVNALAQKLLPLLQKKTDANIKVGETEMAKYPDAPKMIVKATVNISSTDLKKTDSLVNPIVGEIVWTESETRTTNGDKNFSKDRLTLTLGIKDGVWFPLTIIRKTEDYFPRNEYVHLGETKTLEPSWCEKEVAEAQR